MYSNPVACIKNNGYMSRDIQIERSIRQGCPVLVLLYILSVEILAIVIRQSNQITGIEIKGEGSVKLMQYADDAVLFLKDQTEMEKSISIVNSFGSVAGTLLNMSKCEGLWLGTYKNRQMDCTLFGIKWPTDPIRCLGIYIGYNKDANDILNWQNRKN